MRENATSPRKKQDILTFTFTSSMRFQSFLTPSNLSPQAAETIPTTTLLEERSSFGERRYKK